METKRLYYIDWLRVLVILSLIPFHGALTYLRYGIVYIKEPVTGLSALPFLVVVVPTRRLYHDPFIFRFGHCFLLFLQKQGQRRVYRGSTEQASGFIHFPNKLESLFPMMLFEQ